jgi:hypothetical protein
MGKIISIIGGTVAVVVGVMLIFRWIFAFKLGLEFSIIIFLLMGGLIAVIAGVSEIKDSLAVKKEETTEEKK